MIKVQTIDNLVHLLRGDLGINYSYGLFKGWQMKRRFIPKHFNKVPNTVDEWQWV
jgi:hypothetical protein